MKGMELKKKANQLEKEIKFKYPGVNIKISTHSNSFSSGQVDIFFSSAPWALFSDGTSPDSNKSIIFLQNFFTAPVEQNVTFNNGKKLSNEFRKFYLFLVKKGIEILGKPGEAYHSDFYIDHFRDTSKTASIRVARELVRIAKMLVAGDEIVSYSDKELLAFIKLMISTNDKWATRALERIYDGQQDDEKESEETSHLNGIGFSGYDAKFLTGLYKSYEQHDGTLTQKQMASLKKIMPKYAGQIMRSRYFDREKCCKIYAEYLERKSNKTASWIDEVEPCY